MKSRRDQSLFIRIAAILVVFLFIALAAAAYLSGREVQRRSVLISTDAVPGTIIAHEMRMAVSRSIGWTMVAASAQSAQSRDEHLKVAHEADVEFAESVRRYQTTNLANPEKDRKLLADVTTLYEEYHRQRAIYEKLILAGKRDDAAGFLERELVPLYESVRKSGENLLSYNHANSMTYATQIRDSVRRLYWAVAIVTLLAAICCAVLIMQLAVRARELRELHDSEEKFAKAFQINPSGIAISNLETGRFIEVNESFCRMYGCTPQEAIGRTSLELGFWKSMQERSSLFQPLLDTGSLRNFEIQRVNFGGENRTVSMNADLIELGGKRCVLSQIEDITDRKRLQEKRTELANIVENSADAIIGESLLGVISSWNRGAESIFGYTAAEAIGQPLVMLIPPECRHEQVENLAKIARGETVRHFQSVRVCKDGRRIFASITISPLKDANGHVLGASKILRDVTEQKQAELRIQHLNRVYAVLSDINKNIVREKDSGAMLSKACRIAVQQGGFRMAWIGMIDVVLEKVRPVASAGVVEGYLDSLNIDVSGEETDGGPAAQCFVSGKHCICSDIERDWSSHPWREEALKRGYRSSAYFPLKVGGNVRGIFCLYADESEFFDRGETRLLDELAMDIGFALEVSEGEENRRKAERELRWRTAFFEAQVHSAIDGILVVDNEGRKILQNQRISELWKIPPEVAADPDDSRQRRFVVERVKDPQAFAEKIAYLNAHPDETSNDIIEQVDGTILERYSAPVQGRDGTRYGRVWTFHDLTERRKIEQQLFRSQRMESIGTLAGGIAHDLNNVLSPIMMSLDILQMKFTDESSQELLQMIGKSAQHGADMVRQVLSFARGVEGRRMELQVKHLVRDIEKIANDTFLKNVEVRTTVPHDLWTVLADPTQLHQVLLNLCVNARDAMPNGGKLVITAENLMLDSQYSGLNPEATPGPYILIKVQDNGSGIPPEALEKIFDPFFTTKEIGKGTGLGLSTTLAIVKSHQGFIRVDSEPGKGTTFQIYLPAQTEASAASAENMTPEMPIGHGELILVVDDEAVVREITKQTLETFGYRALLACDGSDAAVLYAGRKGEIAAVLTDMMMPVMDGPATIEVLRRIDPAVRVIIASGVPGKETAARQARLGVKHFLAKPFSAEALLRVLRQVLSE